jgi:hypothetical protein
MHWKGTPQVLHIDKLNASRELLQRNEQQIAAKKNE